MTDKHVENSIEFLLFSYFNLDIEEAKSFENALEKSIEKAYVDATNQGAFNTLLKNTNINENEISKITELHQQCKKNVLTSDNINKLINSSNQKEYDYNHNDDICKKLVCTYKELSINNEPLFTYGNAQKWVNMTMKYLYIIAGCLKATNTENDWTDNILEKSKLFHVPVDSYILKAASKNQERIRNNANKNKHALNLRIVPLKHNYDEEPSKNNYYSDDNSQPWSKMNCKDYYNIMNSLKETLTNNVQYGNNSINWECKAWIEQAKIEKGLKNEK